MFLLSVGSLSYISIPKESNPEIPIPFVYVSTGIDGISPEDSERLLVEPLETEMASITGLKQLDGNASVAFDHGAQFLGPDPQESAISVGDQIQLSGFFGDNGHFC